MTRTPFPELRTVSKIGIISDDIEDEDSFSAVDLTDASFGHSPYFSKAASAAGKTIDFLQDDPSTMTYSRRIALYLMKRFKWYNPQLGNNDSREVVNEEPVDCMHPALAEALQQREEEGQQQQISRDITTAVLTNSSDGMDFFCDTKDDHRKLMEAYPYIRCRKEQPSLEKAWAYFEHVTLTRHILEGSSAMTKPKRPLLTRIYRKLFTKADKKLLRAEPGEAKLPTKLYEPLFTPHNQLGDLGIGVGLYFSTLRAITVLSLLAGILNLPNYLYYQSDAYRPGLSNFDSHLQYLPTFLDGSAVCTDVSWVICVDCDDSTHELDRRATGISSLGNAAPFVLRNNCTQAHVPAALITFLTLILIMVGFVVLNRYLDRMAVVFDEDEQTARDYSVLIRNPPEDASNPQEWHDYFAKCFGAHATVCTTSVNNDILVQHLVRRRETLRKLELMVKPGTALDLDSLESVAAEALANTPWWKPRLFCKYCVPDAAELVCRIKRLTEEIKLMAIDMQEGNCPVKNVFVTFETEEDQQRVLKALSTGILRPDIRQPEEYKFRGEHPVICQEPEEPSTVRWQDMNRGWKECTVEQVFTALLTFVGIFLIAMLINVLHDASVELSALAISAFNQGFPELAKLLTSLEGHASESGKQRSMYFKIALFRWVNTAVVISMITPFTSTVTPGALVNQVYALFFTEIVTSSLVQLIGGAGHFKRHVLAPRMKTQDAMNLCMQGDELELAERYTNMTKILFLTLWYGTIYPLAFFMCAIALHVNYYIDRFSLMRTWKRPPQLGTRISEFSRRYFFSAAIVAMAILSSYFLAGFPFDNLCKVESLNITSGALPHRGILGNWEITPRSAAEQESTIKIRLSEDDAVYQHCVQDFFRLSAFPFVPDAQIGDKEWMTRPQSLVTIVFGWTSVVVCALTIAVLVFRWCTDVIDVLLGSYKPSSRDQKIPFSSLSTISAYVPQVQSKVFSYPLVACNVDGLNEELFEWTDPDRPHVFYDLTKDAGILLRGKGNVAFSKIQCWSPSYESSSGVKSRQVPI